MILSAAGRSDPERAPLNPPPPGIISGQTPRQWGAGRGESNPPLWKRVVFARIVPPNRPRDDSAHFVTP